MKMRIDERDYPDLREVEIRPMDLAPGVLGCFAVIDARLNFPIAVAVCNRSTVIRTGKFLPEEETTCDA